MFFLALFDLYIGDQIIETVAELEGNWVIDLWIIEIIDLD